VLGIVCLTLQSYTTENRAATLTDLLYCAMFTDQINEGPVKLATGALVSINGRPVVITTATFENQSKLNFLVLLQP
jgi:hypothetical protein